MTSLFDAIVRRGRERSVSAMVSRHNRENRHDLLGSLCTYVVRPGFSEEMVAERVGTDVETLRESLSGVRDLTLTEVNHIAIASEIIIEIKVTPGEVWFARERLADKISSLGAHVWDELPESKSSEDSLLHAV